MVDKYQILKEIDQIFYISLRVCYEAGYVRLFGRAEFGKWSGNVSAVLSRQLIITSLKKMVRDESNQVIYGAIKITSNCTNMEEKGCVVRDSCLYKSCSSRTAANL